MAALLIKRPDESRLYNLNFAALLATGESITGVTAVTADAPDGADALTISGITYSATKAQFRLEGGTDGYTYDVKATVTTSDGNTLVDCGELEVTDC